MPAPIRCPAAQPQSERLCGAPGPHRPGRGHRPAADHRAARQRHQHSPSHRPGDGANTTPQGPRRADPRVRTGGIKIIIKSGKLQFRGHQRSFGTPQELRGRSGVHHVGPGCAARRTWRAPLAAAPGTARRVVPRPARERRSQRHRQHGPNTVLTALIGREDSASACRARRSLFPLGRFSPIGECRPGRRGPSFESPRYAFNH